MQAVISLCDHSGGWSRPYVGSRFVLRVDPKHDARYGAGRGIVENASPSEVRAFQQPDGGWAVGLTAGEFAALVRAMGLEGAIYHLTGVTGIETAAGVIAMPPCTDFASSGARHFAAKDLDGRTTVSVAIVRECLDVVQIVAPRWWVMENPVGRIARLVPELGKWAMTFHPHHFGDAFTKLTCLWGSFNTDLPRADVEPVMFEKTSKATGKVSRGSWMWASLGGKSERTKELRSATPPGFAAAWRVANP